MDTVPDICPWDFLELAILDLGEVCAHGHYAPIVAAILEYARTGEEIGYALAAAALGNGAEPDALGYLGGWQYGALECCYLDWQDAVALIRLDRGEDDA